MRKALVAIAVTLLLSACTPEQVALYLHKGVKSVTTEEVKSVTQLYQATVLNREEFIHIVAALHNNPFLVCTRGHESDTAGGYQAYNPAGPWYGAYQFTQGTWNTATVLAGHPELVNVNILTVNGFLQDLVAMTLYRAEGNAPWGGRC